MAEAPLGQLKPVYYWEGGGLGERRQLTMTDRANLSWHPDGNHIAINRTGHPLELWSVPDNRLTRSLPNAGGTIAPPIWEPHGRILAFGRRGLIFIDFDADERVRVTNLHAGDYVYGDWSSACDRIVTAGQEDAALKIVDAATGDEIFTLSTGDAPFTDVAFSPDGRRIATADSAGYVRIWGSADIEPPGDFDYLVTGALARVPPPSAESQP